MHFCAEHWELTKVTKSQLIANCRYLKQHELAGLYHHPAVGKEPQGGGHCWHWWPNLGEGQTIFSQHNTYQFSATIFKVVKVDMFLVVIHSLVHGLTIQRRSQFAVTWTECDDGGDQGDIGKLWQPAQAIFVQLNTEFLKIQNTLVYNKVLLDNYDSQHKLASTGFHLGGQKYFYLRCLENTCSLRILNKP